MRQRLLVATFALLLAALAWLLPGKPAEAAWACAWASEPPCPTAGDCGYHIVDGCCVPRCLSHAICSGPRLCIF